MGELFGLAFMQRALVAGCLVGFLASYFGVFVVQRRLSFLGAGLAHAAFGGVALGLLLQTEPLWVAVPFTILVALSINWIRRSTGLAGDTAIGIVFAVAVALGVIFLSLRETYTADAFTYLFGSILAVTPVDLWITSGVAVAAAALWPMWSRWAYATFDAELAVADGLPVDRDDYVLSVLLAVTVVVSVKVVGILLVAALLVIPAATARLLSPTFGRMTVVASCLGVGSAAAGLILSYQVDVPSGATIILVQAAAFVLVAILARRSGPPA
ncbi:MAG: metal ABC transporter permease [Rhodothermales bacterium]